MAVPGPRGDRRWKDARGAEARAYGAGKLTPFLAYPRSLFNCILLSNFPRRAIDRDTRKGVRLRLISDGPRRLLSALYPPSLSPPLFLFVSLSVGPLARPRSHSSVLSLSPFLSSLSLPPSSSTTSSTSPTSTPSGERAPRAPAGRPPLGLFKTTHSQCVRRRTASAQGRLARLANFFPSFLHRHAYSRKTYDVQP